MRQAASESDLGKPQTLQMALLQGYMPVQTPLIEQIEQPAQARRGKWRKPAAIVVAWCIPVQPCEENSHDQ